MPEERDVLIYVDDEGDDRNDGTHPERDTPSRHGPVRTADRAFSLLPPYWLGSAQIIFKATSEPYTITTDTLYLGTPLGTRASPLIIRGAYEPHPIFGEVTAISESSGGDEIHTAANIPADDLLGLVLRRITGTGSPLDTAISIRGNTIGPSSTILLQRALGPVAIDERFRVEQPAVTLRVEHTLNLISHDARSLNLTLIGIRIVTRPGGLNLFNVRAQCDTCEIDLRGSGFIHSNSRIQGGIHDANLSPDPSDLMDPTRRSRREQAGVFIHSDDLTKIFFASRGGVLAGHLAFKKITVQVSQGGTFVPKSLEAVGAPIHILAGGTALSERDAGRPAGWGTLTNKARIRDVATSTRDGDGLRIFNGGLMAAAGPIHLNVSGCQRDGIRLDSGSAACFGLPGGEAGLVTWGSSPNGGFGMNVRNGSRALVGTDAAIARVPSVTAPTPLSGTKGQVALDGRLERGEIVGRIEGGWERVVGNRWVHNDGLSLVRVNLGDVTS